MERVHDLRAIDLMPRGETINYLGAREVPPPVPGVPDHAEAVRHSLRQIGWAGSVFDVYRCTVRYPVLHTMVRIAVLTSRAT